jgi:hypothetical protein
LAEHHDLQRQLRMLFLLHPRDGSLNLNKTDLVEAAVQDHQLQEFLNQEFLNQEFLNQEFLNQEFLNQEFLNHFRQTSTPPWSGAQMWSAQDHTLHDYLVATQTQVHLALGQLGYRARHEVSL